MNIKDFRHELSKYGFSTEVQVRLSETDAVGIVFFGTYAHYFDIGRMDYLAHLGLNLWRRHPRPDPGRRGRA